MSPDRKVMSLPKRVAFCMLPFGLPASWFVVATSRAQDAATRGWMMHNALAMGSLSLISGLVGWCMHRVAEHDGVLVAQREDIDELAYAAALRKLAHPPPDEVSKQRQRHRRDGRKG